MTAAKFAHKNSVVDEDRFHEMFVFHCCEVKFFHQHHITYRPFLFPSATNKTNHCLLMKYLSHLHKFMLEDPILFKDVPDEERTVQNKSKDASFCKGSNWDANMWRISFNGSIGLNDVNGPKRGTIVPVSKNQVTSANKNFVILFVTALAFVITTGSCGSHTQTKTIEKMSADEKKTFQREMKHNAGYVK